MSKKKVMPDNFYQRLQVNRDASPEVIEAAYKALIKKFHPDVEGGDTRIAVDLNDAYETLSDTKKREKYDKEIDDIDRKGTVIGSYRVLEQIAEGGFGRTYKGEHLDLKEPVCIKDCSWIDPAVDKILMEEAKTIWDLRHFSIPAVRDLVKLDNNRLALIMSYIPGKTLEQVIEKTSRLDPETVAWITERALNALKYLHYHGVIHGDVKPQNIIIQPESHTIVLVDYGLSLVCPTSKSGAKGYTEYFAPPEQLAGKPLLPESDFYSLGMTMIYALSGGMKYVQAKEVPDKVPDVFRDFIGRLIVRDILKRPNWRKEDLCETITKIRLDCFGRTRSGMKPIPGI